MKVAWGLVVLILAAGCSDAPEATDDGDDTFAEAVVTSETGAISGVIVDPAIVPVEGVSLFLKPASMNATSDADGAFIFEGLAPGVYFVAAEGPGFLGSQASIEVVAGEVAKLRMIVERDSSRLPSHETLRFDWYDSSGITLVDFIIDLTDETFLGDTAPPACDECQFWFDVAEPPASYVVEATWTDTVSSPFGDTNYYWTLADGDAWNNAYEDGYFAPREPAYVNGTVFGTQTHMQVKMTADELWVTMNQAAEMFVTVFYVEPHPDEWSFFTAE